MLEKYSKIKNVFEFSPDYNSVVGIQEPFKTLKDIRWRDIKKVGVEKIWEVCKQYELDNLPF